MAVSPNLEGERIGEVVETSSTRVVVQCYRLYGAPPLGALVRMGEAPVYAVVSGVTTASADPGRRVMARGRESATEEEVYRENPHLAQLLQTRFEAIIVGHGAEEGPRHYLPPSPPRLYAFVYTCTPQEVVGFTASFDFLHLLTAHQDPIADEVVSACLRQAALARPPEGRRPFLVEAGRALAGELAGQAPRLNAILRRLAL